MAIPGDYRSWVPFDDVCPQDRSVRGVERATDYNRRDTGQVLTMACDMRFALPAGNTPAATAASKTAPAMRHLARAAA